MRLVVSVAACTLAGALLAGQALVSPRAAAEPIPRYVLADTYERCVAINRSQAQMDYCWCIASTMSAELTHQQIRTFDGEGKAAGKTWSTVIRETPELWNIVQSCRVSAGGPRLQ